MTALGISQAEGALFTYSTTIDLSTGFIAGAGPQAEHRWLISGAPAITLQVGDTLSGTLSFLPGQRLGFSDPLGTASEYIAFRLFSPNLAFYGFSSSLAFLDPQASLDTANPWYGGGGGPSFSTQAYAVGLTNGAVSFSGLDYSINITSGGGTFTPDYLLAQFNVGFGEIVVSGVPEPASSGVLAGLSLLAVAAASRRRWNATAGRVSPRSAFV